MDDTAPKKAPIIFDGMALPPFKPLREDPEKRFQEIRNLDCRADDVILATYPKSGTHWIWEVVCMLINGSTEYMKEPKEFLFLEAIPDLGAIESLRSPRPLNTHIPYRWMPKQHIENGGKIVHVIRNPKDVAVSMYHHLLSSGEFNKDFTFEHFLTKIFSGPVSPMGSWYSYVREYERAADQDQRGALLTVYYENMKKRPQEETTRLAKFLNIEASDKLIADIVEKCSFENLKAADKTIKDQSYLDKIIDIGEVARLSQPVMYRKGVIGDWKNHFTLALNEQFDKDFQEKMKNSNLHIQFE